MVYNMPVFEMIELLKYIIDIMSGHIWTSPYICTVKLLKIYVFKTYSICLLSTVECDYITLSVLRLFKKFVHISMCRTSRYNHWTISDAAFVI